MEAIVPVHGPRLAGQRRCKDDTLGWLARLRPMKRHLLLALALSAVICLPAWAQGARVLVFTKTSGFRHDSIPRGIALVHSLGASHGFRVDSTDDASRFTR